MGNVNLPTASQDQVNAFRLESHGLSARRPLGALLEAAGACGVQNTPPGAAGLSLHARLAGLTPSNIERALEKEKSLLQVWSLRASPTLFPAGDAGIFTLGLLPEDEESTRAFIYGVEKALDKIGIRATELIDLTAQPLLEVLDGRALTKDELGVAIASRIAAQLVGPELDAWKSPSWYAPGQSLGESAVRFVLPVLALRGLCCHAERQGNQAAIRRTDQWLGAPIPQADRSTARAELLRRYLSCYGPSTALHFAQWAGVSRNQAGRMWQLVENELVEFQFNGKKTCLYQLDLPRFQSPPSPEGVRFLPPHDPYLQLRDRATLIPDQAIQRYLWRAVGSPGAVLVNGRLAAAWRSRKKGSRLVVTVEPFKTILPEEREEIEAEACLLAPFKNCLNTEVVISDPS